MATEPDRTITVLTTGRQADPRRRHRNTGGGDHAYELDTIDWINTGHRRTGNRHQIINGHRVGHRIKVRQLRNQCGTIFAIFAHTDNTAGTHMNARLTHLVQSVETIFMGVCTNDLTVKFGIGIQIMVVVV